MEHIRGNLNDHYDPRSKVLKLSDPIYNSTSLAAVGVAAHECGHAIQDASGYAPLKIRSALVPAANFGSQLSWPLFYFRLDLFHEASAAGGIILFCAALQFQIVTLPVELTPPEEP